MKQSFKKLLAVLLTLIFITGIIPGFSLQTKADEENLISVTQEMIDNQYKGDAANAIRAALEEAELTATDEAPVTVRVEPGAYELTRRLDVPSNTILDLTGVEFKSVSGTQFNMLMIRSYQDIHEAGYCYHNIKIIGGTFDHNNGTTVAFKGAHAENVVIENVTVKNTTNAHLMEYAGVRNLTITGCTFENQTIGADTLYYEAIQIDVLVKEHFFGYKYEALPNSGITISNCVFRDVPRGVGSHTAIHNRPVDGVTITDCEFYNCDSAAIQGQNWNNAYIAGNTISDCARGIVIYSTRSDSAGAFPASFIESLPDSVTSEYSSGISDDYIRETCINKNITITGNTITTSGNDPYAYYKKGAIIVEGTVLEKRTGIDSQDGSGNIPAGDYCIENVTISDNTIKTSGDGLRLLYTKAAVLSGNGITAAFASGDTETYYGIQLRDTAQADEISSNTLSTGFYQGIMINVQASANLISDNYIPNPTRYGIVLEDASAGVIQNNTISNAQINGIMIFEGSTADTISGNKITKPQKYGIDVVGATVGDIKDNTITDAPSNAIFLYESGHASNISGNVIRNCGNIAIDVNTNSSVTNYIKDNQIYDSTSAAIRVAYDSKAKGINNNLISNTGWHSIAVVNNSIVEQINNNSITVPSGYYGFVIMNKGTVNSASGNYIKTDKSTPYYVNESDGSKLGSYKGLTPVTSLSISKSQADVVIGKTLKLTATVKPANASLTWVNWTSSNPSIASVDKNGVVTVHKYGIVTITATSADGSNKKATCKVQARFSDVTDPSKYYFKHVYWAANSEITKGYSSGEYAGEFGYYLDCSRKDMMTFLWRMAGKPEPTKKTSPFSDVQNPSAYYYKAVLWGVEKGITNGYSSGEYAGQFGIDLPCTREQAMTFLWRMAKKPDPVSTSTEGKPLADITEDAYYYKAVLWAADNGITNGYSSGEYAGKFGVGVSCLREHMVTFLSRYWGKFGK